MTVHVPLPLLDQVAAGGFDWQVPGLREELVIALIRSLPKAIRRNFVPVPDFARAALARIAPAPTASRCSRRVSRRAAPDDRRDGAARRLGPGQGARPPADDLPGGRRRHASVARARTWPRCRRQLRAEGARDGGRGRAGRRPHRAARRGTSARCRGRIEQVRAGFPVTAYPALVDEGATVGVEVFESPGEQEAAMVAGTRRLLLLTAALAGAVPAGPADQPGRSWRCAATRTAASATCSTTAPARPSTSWSADGRRAGLGRRRVRRAARHGPRRPGRHGRRGGRPGASACSPTAHGVEQRLGRTSQRSTLLPALADIRGPARRRWSTAGFVTETGWTRTWPTCRATWRRSSAGWTGWARTRPATAPGMARIAAGAQGVRRPARRVAAGPPPRGRPSSRSAG